MSTFTFTTRETYISWRIEWKAKYKSVSQNIRDTKLLFKAEQRKIVWDKKTYGKIEYCVPIMSDLALYWQLLANIAKYRKEARELLEELIEAKQEAERQYVLAKIGENIPISA